MMTEEKSTHQMANGQPCGIIKVDHAGWHISIATANRQRKSHTDWKKANRDHVLAQHRDYYADHAEEQLAHKRKYRADHAEECHARDYIYRADHAEERRAYDRAYREDNRGYAVTRAACSRNAAMKRGAWIDPEFTTATLVAILLAHENCARCGLPCSLRESEIDHIRPIAIGGEHSADNVQVLCIPCHTEKNREDIASLTLAA
jgi:5-methylcytosine-specific restriction endonuclease McrA